MVAILLEISWLCTAPATATPISPRSLPGGGMIVIRVMPYLQLLPTVYVVLAVFGALFVVVGTLLRAWLGPRYVWAFWALYLVAVCVSCIYKLSGLQFAISLSTVGHTIYLAIVAFVAVGFPLALGAILLTRKSVASHLRAATLSWLTIVAATPLAVALIAVVDYFNLAVITL